ncbi:prepilin-type N-terminal cleavage/methylation domain-containing protein [Alkalibacterium indicireducens]|uniref:Prepilin-type N-terminal cleavage/methylation domain-containing protein n=1 Tax=Alkalibacterium indicireducens TaxID=398758 RepID=A0ABP3KUZ3_9LACT
MRNKIRQMMKKEDGFTLVELLAVIVILGIILAIAIPAIGGVISRANTDAETAENALIEDAARLYFTQNDGATEVSVGTLVEENYLDPSDGNLSSDNTRMVDRTDTGGAELRT